MDVKTQATMFSTGTTEWRTPREEYDPLDAEFGFTLDAAATKENALCKKYYTKEDDGLSQSWEGERVFCNPPYGKKESPCKRTVDAMTGEVTYLCTKKICKTRGYHIDEKIPDTGAWIEKAYNESLHCLAVLLIPARTDTAAWHKYILSKDGKTPLPGVDYRLKKGRIRFINEQGQTDSAPFPTAVVIFNRGGFADLPVTETQRAYKELKKAAEKSYAIITEQMMEIMDLKKKAIRKRALLIRTTQVIDMIYSIKWDLQDKFRAAGILEEVSTLQHFLQAELAAEKPKHTKPKKKKLLDKLKRKH